MSKTKKELNNRPLVFKKDQKKLQGQVLRRIDRKIAIQKKVQDPFNIRGPLEERMLRGKIGYLNNKGDSNEN